MAESNDAQRAEEFKSGFGKAGCHIENIGELLQEFDAEFVDEVGGPVKLEGTDVLKLMGLLYNKFVETFAECEGREVVIEFGDSVGANLAESLVKLILDLAKSSAPDTSNDQA